MHMLQRLCHWLNDSQVLINQCSTSSTPDQMPKTTYKIPTIKLLDKTIYSINKIINNNYKTTVGYLDQNKVAEPNTIGLSV